MPEYKYKRQVKNILINKPLQREYTMLIIIIMMLSSLLVGFIIHYTLKQGFLGSPYRIGKVSPYEVLSEVNYLLIVRVSLAMFFSIVVAGICGIVFLHRVAGPVYRFHMTLRRWADTGETPKEVKLREGDFFQEVAGEFNRVFKLVNEHEEKVQKVALRLSELPVGDLRPDLAGPIRKAVEDLKQV